MPYLNAGPTFRTPNAGPRQSVRCCHLQEILVADRANGRLGVIASHHGVDAVAPDVRAKLGECEARIKSDNTFAEIGSQLALTAGAHVEVVDIDFERLGELFALRWLREKEVGSEVHVTTRKAEGRVIIEQKGVLSKTFCMFIKMFGAGSLGS